MGYSFLRKNNKVIVRLSGGFGNQMFQFSYAIILSKILNKKIFIDDFILRDYISNKKYTKRTFELNIFNNSYNFYVSDFLNPFPYRGKVYSIISAFKSKFNNIFLVGDDNLIDLENISSLNRNLYLKGEFQKNIDYHKYRNLLINNFCMNNLKDKISDNSNLLLEKINNTNSVSIHVRRGDYLKDNNINTHGLCSLEYYSKAIEILIKNSNKLSFFIFSDDLEWCKSKFSFSNDLHFCDGNFIEDFFLMSKCKNNIIANSSFSWWAAFLNENIKKTVIYPSNWFADKNVSIYFPKKWIKL